MLMAALIGTGTLVPVELRCEELTNPVSAPIIDGARVSWKLKEAQAGLKDLKQTAYQIRVGSKVGAADLYDSGKVNSSEQYGIRLPKLPSGRRVYWQTKVWDQANNASDWSKPATFGTGIERWQANWLSIPASESEASPFEGAHWIWGSADTITFERRLEASAAEAAGNSSIDLTVDDQFELFLNDVRLAATDGRNDGWKRPVRLDLKGKLKAGTNTFRVVAKNNANSPAGFIGVIKIGDRTVKTDTNWVGNGGPVESKGVFGTQPWGTMDYKLVRSTTYYRRDFNSDQKPIRAVAYVSARGLVDLHLNGKLVSQDRFTPGWTDYEKRLYYASYDVTS